MPPPCAWQARPRAQIPKGNKMMTTTLTMISIAGKHLQRTYYVLHAMLSTLNVQTLSILTAISGNIILCILHE